MRAQFAFLRTLAAVGLMAVPALATPAATSEPSSDAVTLSAHPAAHPYPRRRRWQCHRAARRPRPLGRLVDHCKVGVGPDDCQLIHRHPTPDGEHGYVVTAGKGIPTDHLTVLLAHITGVEPRN